MELHPTAVAFANAYRIKRDVVRAKDRKHVSVESPRIQIRRDSAIERRYTEISARPTRSGQIDADQPSVEMMVDQTNTKTLGKGSSRKLVYASLTPDNARELAAYLLAAADEAEVLFKL